VHLLSPGQLNTYDVLISDDVVFTESALQAFLAGPATGKSVKAAATSTESAHEDLAPHQIDSDVPSVVKADETEEASA
jgi:large subunit ribosomal protein L4